MRLGYKFLKSVELKLHVFSAAAIVLSITFNHQAMHWGSRIWIILFLNIMHIHFYLNVALFTDIFYLTIKVKN
jgi:hypothetical protein